MTNPFSNRGIAVWLTLLVVLAPVLATTPAAAQGQSPPAQYTTGRPVDSIALEHSGRSLSLLVSDDQHQGTVLTINRGWLKENLGRDITFTRFYRNGELIDSYQITDNTVVIDIPHFSTQNITATAVDAQYKVTGSAAGESTTRIINYDVDSTGSAVLGITGQGTTEGTKVVDQYFAKIDSQNFTWTTGEIPRNVTLEVIGKGEKFGPTYNESVSNVADGSTEFFDLVADDYNTNVTVVGAGQENGTPVTKGTFRGDGDGDSRSISFGNEQSNESIVFIGNKTTTVTEESRESSFDGTFSPHESNNVHVNNGVLKLSQVDTTTTKIFNYTGSVQTWTVPANVNSINATLIGAGGGGSDAGSGADGGRIEGTVQVSPGDTIYIYAAEGGNTGTSSSGGAGGWGAFNGGDGPGGQGFGGAGGGGGSTTIRLNSDTESAEVLTAGAGGGARSPAIDPGDGGGGGAEGGLGGAGSGSGNDGGDAGGTDGSGGDGEDSIGDPPQPGTGNVDNPSITSNIVNQTGAGASGGGGDGGDGSVVIEYTESSVAESGYYTQRYNTTDDANYAKLNWTEDETNGTVRSFVKFDGDSYTEWLNADNDTWKNLTDGQDVYVNFSLEKSSGSGPTLSRYGVNWNQSATVNTTDPTIDTDGDGTDEGSHTGTLSVGQSVTVPLTEGISEGSKIFTVHTSSGSIVDWRYEGNNDDRLHPKNVSLNGVDYTVDQFLANGENTTIIVSNTDTLEGQNSVTYNDYGDTETSTADRIDIRGEYENRAIVDNYTVNGNTHDLDAVLADAQKTSVDITTDAVYGDNDIKVGLKENSTQDNYDANVTWYKENRTLFTNVSVNGQKYTGTDEYTAVTYNASFLSSGETLTFDVTSDLQPGDNTHEFRMLSPRTTTDTLDFVEKMEFEKNVTVEIEEKHGSYIKTITESFNHTITSGAFFNFSKPSRVMRIHSADVSNTSTSGIANTTTVADGQVKVQVNDQIEKDVGYTVRVEMRKYNVTNADEELRAENDLAEPYLVDVGISSVDGDVGYETVEKNLTRDQWEIVLTQSGSVSSEGTDEATFANGNVTIPQSNFDGSVGGFVVERPRYSKHTYTGTTNTIHPSAVISPNRTVTHDPGLFSEPDETYVKVSRYSTENLDSPLEVVWKKNSDYHLKWTTNKTSDSNYDQIVDNVTTDAVSVFADGERYRDIARDGDELTIHVNGSTTWDMYQYDKPVFAEDPTFTIPTGQTKIVEVVVENPNSFTLHDAHLVLDHGWVEDVTPKYQDISAENTSTFEVTIHVPAGAQATDYTVPMNVTSQETGEIDTRDITVSTSGGIAIAGAGLGDLAVVAAVVVLFLGMMLLQARRSGSFDSVTSELEEL